MVSINKATTDSIVLLTLFFIQQHIESVIIIQYSPFVKGTIHANHLVFNYAKSSHNSANSVFFARWCQITQTITEANHRSYKEENKSS